MHGRRATTVLVIGTGTWLDTIGRIFSPIPDLATPREVQTALAGDPRRPGPPSLLVGLGATSATSTSTVSSRAGAGPGREVTPIEYPTRKIGAMLAPPAPPRGTGVPRLVRPHDPHRDGAGPPPSRLVAKLEQLRASRLRIVARGRRGAAAPRAEPARRRAATAHGLAVPAPRPPPKAAGDEELVALVDGALAELEGALGTCASSHAASTRRSSPREGLAAALQAGAKRSTVPVELDLRLPERLPPAARGAPPTTSAPRPPRTRSSMRSASQVWLERRPATTGR